MSNTILALIFIFSNSQKYFPVEVPENKNPTEQQWQLVSLLHG